MNSGTDSIRSTSSSQNQRESQTSTIKQLQNEHMESRGGNPFPTWCQLCYPNSTEYLELLNDNICNWNISDHLTKYHNESTFAHFFSENKLMFVLLWFHITKTYLYNFDPLEPHFYTVKLGFTGVYIIFLISAQKHRLWVLVRTASARRF